jgi:hypothetical protein
MPKNKPITIIAVMGAPLLAQFVDEASDILDAAAGGKPDVVCEVAVSLSLHSPDQ